MNYIYITGTSSGIGKALAEHLLEDTNNYVIGLSRRCKIEHERYEHKEIDLMDAVAVNNFIFSAFDDAQSYTLINNAGVLGELGHIGNLNNKKLTQDFQVNLIAPAVLMNTFIYTYRDFAGKKVILNTSSGAAYHTVPSWGMYCSTKAGLDMYTRVIHDEQKEREDRYPIYAFSVAPGVIDTPMQEKIRSTSKSVFQNVDRFINLWKNNELVAPKEVAQNFERIIKQPDKFTDPSMDLREQ